MSRAPGVELIGYGSARGRWVIAASVLGSGIAFLDSTVVNVALPSIAHDLGTGLGGLQWVLTAYLLTLGSLLVLGGSLGDRYGRRRMFVAGLVAFTVTSACAGAAPTTSFLVTTRAVQGMAAALLVPASLAIISASFRPDDRGRAIGAWSGLGGIATAIGPFLGGWLIDAVSWRLVFFINIPLAVAALWVTLRHVPESRDEEADPHLDLVGATLLSLGLAGVVDALIEGPTSSARVAVLGLAGVAALVAFVIQEIRSTHPMVPPQMFRNRQFSGANLVTLVVYGALGAATFLLVLHLQTDLHYSALEAGASLMPITVVMLLFSARSGALAQRIGPRAQMTAGPLVVAVGLLMMAPIAGGDRYLTAVLPGVGVLGIGLVITVAPLTSAVLAAIEDRHAGVAAAVNNAVARVAGLLAVAVLPAAAGMSTGALGGAGLASGFGTAMRISSALAAIGGVVAFLTIRRAAPVVALTQVDLAHPCADPCALVEEPPAA